MLFVFKIRKKKAIDIQPVTFCYGGEIMNRICVEVKEYEEILPELQQVLAELDDDLIGEDLLWI